MYNLLICDDEKDIVAALKIYLSAPDMTIHTAFDGAEALEVLAREEIHLVLLDVMMPRLDGISAMERIRRTSNVPIILLTAKSEETDLLLGLNAGADDYITKPFNPMEVTARVRSQLRRYCLLGGKAAATDTLTAGGLELDDRAKTVTLDGEAVSLTPTEYEILKLLMENPGKVFSPKEIYTAVWKDTPLGCENTVAVHIRHLREKIEFDPASPRYVKVVWGRGYKLDREVGA